MEITPTPTPVAINSKGFCSMGQWLSSKDEQLRAEVVDLLSESASTAALHRFLIAKFDDLDVGLTTFKSHRNKWCSCQ